MKDLPRPGLLCATSPGAYFGMLKKAGCSGKMELPLLRMISALATKLNKTKNIILKKLKMKNMKTSDKVCKTATEML